MSITSIVEKIQSTFQKRMVTRDMAKSFWGLLKTYEDGILLIDLVDDRFRLNIFDGGGAHTVSAEYSKVAKPPLDGLERTLNNHSIEYQALWQRALGRLAREITAHGGLQVFVNCVYFVSTPEQTEAEAGNIRKMNAYLAKAYSKLETAFGTQAMIRYPEALLASDPDHKWGVAPFHYKKDTYAFFIQQVKERLS